MFFLIMPAGNGGGISNYHKPCKYTDCCNWNFVFTFKDLEGIVYPKRNTQFDNLFYEKIS